MIDRLPNQPKISAWAIPIVIFFAVLLLIAATLKDYGVTWDEPPYFHATDLHAQWISQAAQNLGSGELSKITDDESIKASWHWNPYNVPHPPFSRIVSALAKQLAAPLVDHVSAYRVGPAIFFALLALVAYLWMRELWGSPAGLFAVFALILIPNLFAYAHIGVTDLPLAALWFLTVYCFCKGLDSWRWSVVLGIVWGLALSTKFPALLIPVPLILWAHLFHRDKYINNLFAMLFLAPAVMVVTQPYLWHQSGLRVLEFLYEGISRGYRPDANFGVFFHNRVWSSQQLPWYYPFYLVGVTTPEPILVLALIGMLAAIWRRQQRSILLLLTGNGLFVLLLGLLPGAVLHDGVRQMLSALPFVAALATAGVQEVSTWLFSKVTKWKCCQNILNLNAKTAAAVLLIACFNPALDLYLAHPFQLSYYNRLVGGIRGAFERGLEITYFMEAITPEFLHRLNEKLPKNATVNSSFAGFMFEFYQKEGRLRRDLRFSDHGPSDFYIVINRRSALVPADRALLRSGAIPVESVSVATVPLVTLFDLRKSP